MISPEYFLHASNIARIFSFSAKDVLWLRIFVILASLIGVPYFYLQTNVLWEPIVWTVLFIGINAYHVWRLWMERRPVELSDDEARLYDLTFFPLSARQFVDLARLGRWANQNPGDVLLRPNEPIATGIVVVRLVFTISGPSRAFTALRLIDIVTAVHSHLNELATLEFGLQQLARLARRSSAFIRLSV